MTTPRQRRARARPRTRARARKTPRSMPTTGPMTRAAALLAILACCSTEPTEPTDTTPPGEEIPTERTPLPDQPSAPEACFHEASTLLACEASERPDDVAAALERLREYLETEMARWVPVESAGPVAVSPPTDLPPPAAELDPIARGVACHAEDGSAAWALYWMARVRHQARRFDQAATLFDEVIARAPNTELAGYSASLALDALLVRARQRPDLEVSCHERMADRVPVYRQRLCESEPVPEDTCAMLVQLQCRLGRRAAEDLARNDDMAAASVAYEGLFQKGCDAGDEALFNAAVTAEHAGDTERATEMRATLAREFPQSALVGR